jgi:hypothetical protein
MSEKQPREGAVAARVGDSGHAPESPRPATVAAPPPAAVELPPIAPAPHAAAAVDLAHGADATVITRFRCGVMSDGALVLERGAQKMELPQEETRTLLAFLERTLRPYEGAAS